jgi:hypothetical protein
LTEHIRHSTAVIGVTHVDDAGSWSDDGAILRISSQIKALDYPIFSLDARSRDQVKVMIGAMAAMIALNEGAHEQAI